MATQETRATVREVFLSQLEHDGRELRYHVEASGFLRNMVRAMVDTPLLVGEKKVVPEDVLTVIAYKDRAKAGMNVLPHELYFVKASYRLLPKEAK